MEAYPSEYVEHNFPLIVVSGVSAASNVDAIAQEYGRGLAIVSDVPSIGNERGQRLLRAFKDAADNCRSWDNGGSRSKDGLIGFRIRGAGRTYQFPARKAQPPAESPPLTASGTLTESGARPRAVLHSPLSPLSPGSPTYPDGVMTPSWLAKHQSHVPAVVVACFILTANPSRDSFNDNQVKSAIGGIRSTLSQSDLKTRFAVVLLGDGHATGAPDVDERLANIRRPANLDAKSSFFYLPDDTSASVVESFARTVLAALQPLCIDYYRDLTKHTRRKKNRGTIPAPTAPPTKGTSQTLGSLGWGIRYDFKLGVFAEFRQEMESALRHYQSAIEALLGNDGTFETTPSWSPRWDEARLLGDAIALRIIRCLLWSGSTTSAAQSWENYRYRIRDMVDRRGKGSSNYGWEAWESKWAKAMAQLIQRTNLPGFANREAAASTGESYLPIYAPVEKAIPVGERILPWANLHHAGYWYRLAFRHALLRRKLALDMPEEDRYPPDQSPASTMASRHRTYDTYLCPEPHQEFPIGQSTLKGHDHHAEITSHLASSIEAFETRRQRRFIERLQLDYGNELIKSSKYVEARELLQPLLQHVTWRQEKYWDLLAVILRALRQCARALADVKTLITTTYELYSNVFPEETSEALNLLQSTTDLDANALEKQGKIEVRLSSDTITSFLFVTAAFSAGEGNSGDPSIVQIMIRSNAKQTCAPVCLKQVRIGFDNGQREIVIQHENAATTTPMPRDATTLRVLNFSESDAVARNTTIHGSQTDLHVHPNQTLVLECPIVFREMGETSIQDIVLGIESKDFHLTFTSPPEHEGLPNLWWIKGENGNVKSKRIGRDQISKIKILPRPPKMEIRVLDAERQLYTGEPVTLDFEIANNEDEQTISTLEVRLMSRTGESPNYTWVSPQNGADPSMPNPENGLDDLPGYAVGDLKPGQTATRSLTFTAPALPSEVVLEAKILYHLISDRQTPISKVLSGTLVFSDAFEANYEFTPLVHPDPWPTFFGVHSINDIDPARQKKALGLTQRWRLTARMASFAEETLAIEAVHLTLNSASDGAHVKISKAKAPTGPLPISPQEMHEHSFTIDVTKLTLDDRRPSALDMELVVTWKRAATSSTAAIPVTSTLPMPALPVPNAEPRVLLSAYPTADPTLPPLLHLDYVLENPTMHFLTFDLSMEASDDFAFSGSKFTSANLLPLARTTVRYTVLPLVRGKWISPGLKAMDRYFGKQLKVLAAEGARVEKGGRGEIGVWVDADGD